MQHNSTKTAPQQSSWLGYWLSAGRRVAPASLTWGYASSCSCCRHGPAYQTAVIVVIADAQAAVGLVTVRVTRVRPQMTALDSWCVWLASVAQAEELEHHPQVRVSVVA